MPTDNPKHEETCGKCGHIWRSRALTIEHITCPKCQFRPGKPKPAQHHRDNGRGNYNQLEVNRFIKHLGCWTFVNPTDAIKRRDPNDYRDYLEKLIEANTNPQVYANKKAPARMDEVGKMETAAARQALRGLKPA